MTRTAGTFGSLIALLLSVLGAGCADAPPPEADAWPVEIVSIAALSSFAGAETAVSITGSVVRQDDTGVQLTDGTGLVLVRGIEAVVVAGGTEIPEEQEVIVRGIVIPSGGHPEVWALEWAFDAGTHATLDGEARPAVER
ncbi:MAG: hypothetical protein AAF809_05660 [Bacteroidota bacterium]